MEHDKHTFIFVLIAMVFLVLSGAMFRLYREQMNLKTMVSEGLMQMKEELRNTKTVPVVTITEPVDESKVMKKQ